MKFTEALSYIRFKTETDDNTFPISQVNLLANLHKNDLAKEIAEVKEDIFGIPQTRDLVAVQREYDLPYDMLNNIKIVEAFIGNKWRRVEEFDLNNYTTNTRFEDPLGRLSGGRSLATTDEEAIIANFSDERPKYELFRNSLWLFTGSTIPYVAGGLKLWAIMYPKDFEVGDWTGTATIETPANSTTSGFPTQFQKILLDKVVLDFKYRDKPVPVSEIQELAKRVKEAKDAISGTNLDWEMISKLPYNDGSNY